MSTYRNTNRDLWHCSRSELDFLSKRINKKGILPRQHTHLRNLETPNCTTWIISSLTITNVFSFISCILLYSVGLKEIRLLAVTDEHPCTHRGHLKHLSQQLHVSFFLSAFSCISLHYAILYCREIISNL